MTPAEHLQLLGPDLLAEIRLRAAAAPPLTAELASELRTVFASASTATISSLPVPRTAASRSLAAA